MENAESQVLEAEVAKLEQTASYLDIALGILWAGKPNVAAAQVTAQNTQYAKNATTHITARQIYLVECTKLNLQYFCRDIYNTQETVAKHDGNLITESPTKKLHLMALPPKSLIR